MDFGTAMKEKPLAFKQGVGLLLKRVRYVTGIVISVRHACVR